MPSPEFEARRREHMECEQSKTYDQRLPPAPGSQAPQAQARQGNVFGLLKRRGLGPNPRR